MNIKLIIALALIANTVAVAHSPKTTANTTTARHAACTQAKQKIIIYQPWASHSAVSVLQAKTIAKQLNKYGFTHLLLQWSRHGDQRYWLNDPTGQLPKRMRQNSQDLIEGLYSDPDYFQALNLPDAQLKIYLENLRKNSLMEANSLKKQDRSKIEGWYFPEEIDDLNWRTPQRQQILSAHFKSLMSDLKKLNPKTPIYASSFFGGHAKPQDYANMLKKIHQETGIIWLIQDGLGVLRKPQPDTQQYLRIIQRTLPAKAWLGVLETFTELDQVADDRFCPATNREIETRRRLWCSATGREPEVYFSLNQFNNELLGHQNIKCKTRDGNAATPAQQ